MKTQIPVLDRLLLGENALLPIPVEGPSEVLLIRGGPGGGKTTLALQILDQLLEGEYNLAIFVSLELNPLRILEYVSRSFGFSRLLLEATRSDKPGRMVTLTRRAFENILSDLKPPMDYGRYAERLLRSICSQYRQMDPKSHNVVLLIDTLKLFIDAFSKSLKSETAGREALKAFKDVTSNALKQPLTIIFTDELLHRQNSSIDDLLSSYFCDYQIQLAPEPIIGISPYSREDISALGYSVARLRSESTWDAHIATVETRPFCRVIKARYSPHEFRRCLYDIVPGRGVVFYETFPGDGKLVLFAENHPQEQCWGEFAQKELPFRYPSMRFELFNRQALQRTFASQRRLRYVPERTDLYLMSFDTYWVNWYREFFEKAEIHDSLRRFFDVQGLVVSPRDFAVICTILHTLVREYPPPGPKVEISRHVRTVISRIAAETSVRVSDLKHYASQTRKYLLGMWKRVEQFEFSHGMFSPLLGQIRLFGELSSSIIAELEKQDPINRRPLHRTRSGQLIGVPYNANISFLVYRKAYASYSPEEIQQLAVSIYENARTVSAELGDVLGESKLVDRIFRGDTPSRDRVVERLNAAAQSFSMWVPALTSRLSLGMPPVTWEEVVGICAAKRTDFLVEVDTFDTLTSTMLELTWAWGADVVVGPDYRFPPSSLPDVFCGIYYGLRILSQMKSRNILPRAASIDPEYLQSHYEHSRPDAAERRDWMFARHWHSTLVDLLTRRSEQSGQLVWQQSNPELEVCRIPISYFYLAEQVRGLDVSDLSAEDIERAIGTLKHHSCLGEWHLAMLRGSENSALGSDVINNLMSSQKICERAFSGAALPTVEAFYSLYGSHRAFEFPDRVIERLPSITFQGLREYMKSAKSRSQIFDYRHCMRQIHSALLSVLHRDAVGPVELRDTVLAIVENVERLRESTLMVN